MQPGDRLVCALIDPLEPGDRFAGWPLHITIVPWFRLNMPPEQLTAQIALTAAQTRAFTVRLDGTAQFGGGKKVVHLIAEPNPLHHIQQHVRELLHQHNAWLADESTNVRRPFRPHMTDQPHAHVHKGMPLYINALYVVEQQGGNKMVVGKIGLTDEPKAAA